MGGTLNEEKSTFSGAIVLKAKTAAEVKALAAQLEWYAMFEEPFANRYDGGFAMKGQVRATPDFAHNQADAGTLAAQLREQASALGQLEERAAEMERVAASAEQKAAESKKWLDLLTPEEHWRLVGRGLSERGVLVVAPGLGDELVQLLARAILVRAAQRLENDAPDHPHVTQRAADACAAIVRELVPNLQATPENEAARAATIAARFQALFTASESGHA